MSAPDFPPGYEVLEKLGEGGFGAVFKAKQVELGRPVAVKVVTRAGGEDVERFVREGQAVSRLRHPAIVQVFAVDTMPARDGSPGLPFLVFEWVDGGSLAGALAAGPLPGARIVELFRTLMEGLEHAHEHGVCHRDIKPANVLLPKTGGLKIADFGLARLHEGRDRLTKTGAVMGTPTYMSPEQCSGADIDGRADLYSAGVMLYEMLAGAPPFTSASPMAVLRMHVVDPVPPLGDRVSGVPADLVALAMDLLEKDRERRPASATAVLERLAALPAEPFAVVRRGRVRTSGSIKVMKPGVTRSMRTAAAGPSATIATAQVDAGGSRRALHAAIAGAALCVLGLAAFAVRRAPAPPPATPSPGASALAPPALEVVARPPVWATARWPADDPPSALAVHGAGAPPRRIALASGARSVLVTGLEPGGAYELELEGTLLPRARFAMPRPWHVLIHEHKADDHAAFVLAFPPPHGEPVDVIVSAADPPFRELWKEKITSAPRRRVVAESLIPDGRHVLRFACGPERFVRELPFRTFRAGLDERVKAVMDKIRRRVTPTDAEGDLLEMGLSRHTVAEAVAIVRDLAKKLSDRECRYLAKAIGRLGDDQYFDALAPLRTQAIGRAYTSALGWMHTPLAFETLRQWNDREGIAENALLGVVMQDAHKTGEDIAWGTSRSNPERARGSLVELKPEAKTASRMAQACIAFRVWPADPRLAGQLKRRALEDTDVAVARMAVRSLERLRTDAARRVALELLADGSARARELRPAVLRALAICGAPADAAQARSRLTDTDPAVRAGALYALAVLDLAGAVTDLTDRLENDRDSKVVAAAAWGLARLGDARGREALRRALARIGTLPSGSRGRVPRALGWLKDAASVEALVRLAGSTPAPDRCHDQAEALWALGWMKHRPSRGLFGRALTSVYPCVRFRALEALAAVDLAAAQAASAKVPRDERLEDHDRMLHAAGHPMPGARIVLVDHAFPDPAAFTIAYGEPFLFDVQGAWDRELRPDACLGLDGAEKTDHGFIDTYPSAFSMTWPDDGPHHLAWTEDLPWITNGSGPTVAAAHFTYDRTETFDGVGFVTLRVRSLGRPLLEP